MTEVVEREVVTWSELASAGVLGLAVPEFLGGEGLGLAELSVVLERLGARAADVPAWETLVGGTLTIAAAATPDQQKRLIRSEEHTSELQSLMRISYDVFCVKKKKKARLVDTII